MFETFLKDLVSVFAQIQPYASFLFHKCHLIESMLAATTLLLGLVGRCLTLTTVVAGLVVIGVAIYEVMKR